MIVQQRGIQMKILFCPITALLLLLSSIGYADEIHLKDGTVIKGKIIRVTEKSIEYDPEGEIPFDIYPREKALKLKYDNGTVVQLAPGVDKDKSDSGSNDRLYLKDGKVLEGSVTDFDAKSITYIPAGQKEKISIPRSTVVRIVYPDGSTVFLAKEPVEERAPFPERKKSSSWLFSTDPASDPERPRSIVWIPLISFFLPGFDQWWEGQYPSAVFYTGIGILGISLIEEDISDKNPTDSDLTDGEKKSFYGAQLYQTAGSLSAFHSFKTAVKTHQGTGRFSFLQEEETTGDVLLAPFRLDFLLRPTTFLPVGVAAVISGIALATSEVSSMRGRDILYVSGLSYNAGTGEEAVFRGWMMPLMMDWMDSPFWSNTTTALLFALSHLGGDIKYPIAQFAMGWYLGWVTQQRNWTIAESVFIHTWWDLIILGTLFTLDPDEETNVLLPVAFIRF